MLYHASHTIYKVASAAHLHFYNVSHSWPSLHVLYTAGKSFSVVSFLYDGKDVYDDDNGDGSGSGCDDDDDDDVTDRDNCVCGVVMVLALVKISGASSS